MRRLDRASVAIQRWWRRRHAARAAWRRRYADLLAWEASRAPNATAIARVWRGHRARRTAGPALRRRAALRAAGSVALQRLWRGCRGRRRADDARCSRTHAAAVAAAAAAATRLAAWQRGLAARRRAGDRRAEVAAVRSEACGRERRMVVVGVAARRAAAAGGRAGVSLVETARVRARRGAAAAAEAAQAAAGVVQAFARGACARRGLVGLVEAVVLEVLPLEAAARAAIEVEAAAAATQPTWAATLPPAAPAAPLSPVSSPTSLAGKPSEGAPPSSLAERAVQTQQKQQQPPPAVAVDSLTELRRLTTAVETIQACARARLARGTAQQQQHHHHHRRLQRQLSPRQSQVSFSFMDSSLVEAVPPQPVSPPLFPAQQLPHHPPPSPAAAVPRGVLKDRSNLAATLERYRAAPHRLRAVECLQRTFRVVRARVLLRRRRNHCAGLSALEEHEEEVAAWHAERHRAATVLAGCARSLRAGAEVAERAAARDADRDGVRRREAAAVVQAALRCAHARARVRRLRAARGDTRDGVVRREAGAVVARFLRGSGGGVGGCVRRAEEEGCARRRRWQERSAGEAAAAIQAVYRGWRTRREDGGVAGMRAARAARGRRGREVEGRMFAALVIQGWWGRRWAAVLERRVEEAEEAARRFCVADE